ncbi:MAG TPA: SigE family RNA polymerase sigma factor [Mycobacteriales bacterium]|nr:SigE family RNA polymerase sigma factor [Mycobacteriales bacterium]
MSSSAEEEFSALVTTRSDALVRTAFLLTGDWGKAEDLLQTALAKTWTRWSALEHPAAAEAYVRRVMATTSIKWWRRRWGGEIPTSDLPPANAPDGYALVEHRDALARGLARLTPRQRAVLVLRYYDDLPEAEVAALLGCSVGTVKSTSSRALARLRDLDLLDSTDPTTPARTALPAWETQS